MVVGEGETRLEGLLKVQAGRGGPVPQEGQERRLGHVPLEPRRGGRPPSYNPKVLVVCLLPVRELRRDYRGVESRLRARRNLLEVLGLERAWARVEPLAQP